MGPALEVGQHDGRSYDEDRDAEHKRECFAKSECGKRDKHQGYMQDGRAKALEKGFIGIGVRQVSINRLRISKID